MSHLHVFAYLSSLSGRSGDHTTDISMHTFRFLFIFISFIPIFRHCKEKAYVFALVIIIVGKCACSSC